MKVKIGKLTAKVVHYRDYKNFSIVDFLESLNHNLNMNGKNNENFNNLNFWKSY